MGRLIYPTNVSLDGYIEDEQGVFAWLPVDDQVFAHHTGLMRSASVLLYGRRLYEAMAVWETDADLAAQSTEFADFAAAWRTPSKIVYSTSLLEVPTSRTSIERRFDPAAVEDLKSGVDGDLVIGGADLAAQAIGAGLVDEVQLSVLPLSVGGGKPGLPTGMRADFDLLEARRLGTSVVLLRYGRGRAPGHEGETDAEA